MFAVCTPHFSGYGTIVPSVLQAIPLLHLQFFLDTITCTGRINDLFSSVLMVSSSSLFLWVSTSALFIWRRRKSLLQSEEDKQWDKSYQHKPQWLCHTSTYWCVVAVEGLVRQRGRSTQMLGNMRERCLHLLENFRNGRSCWCHKLC